MAIRVPDITKRQLEDSVDGKPILVSATATAGDSIHTASATAGILDEVFLAAHNTSDADVVLTLEIGGTTVGFQRVVTVPANSTIWIISGDIVLGNEVNIAAFAETADVINITGYVNRVDQSGA